MLWSERGAVVEVAVVAWVIGAFACVGLSARGCRNSATKRQMGETGAEAEVLDIRTFEIGS